MNSLRLLRKLPLIGPVFACSLKEHGSALKDFLITVLFSTMTFWLTAFILSVLEKNTGLGYADLLQSTIQNGELFIFSVGILGPMLITVTDESRKQAFPAQTWLLVLLAIAAVVCGALFALMKTSASVPELFINKNQALYISFWVAGLSCFLRYLTIAYNKSLANINLHADEQSFKDAFADRHGRA